MRKIARISINGKRIQKSFATQLDADKWLSVIRNHYSDPSLFGELWNPIPEFSRYEASTHGRVRSLNYKNTGLIKVIKPSSDESGYLCSMFQKDDGTYITKAIHLMIAYAWLGIKSDLTVDHINGNKKDNTLFNLEWVTRSENCRRSFVTGCQKPKVGELNGASKLTTEQVLEIRKRKLEGGRFWGRNELAKELNISPKHLQKIANKAESTWYNV